MDTLEKHAASTADMIRIPTPSFVPSTIMEETLEEMKRKRSPGGG
jgi:hypothetical protein